MKEKPVINAGSMGPDELEKWLLGMANNITERDSDWKIVIHELNSATRSLRYVSGCLVKRINFLDSDQIIHSADHSSVIQEEVHNLRVTAAAVRNSQQTILASIAQLQKIECPNLAQGRTGHHPECGAQEMEKARGGLR